MDFTILLFLAKKEKPIKAKKATLGLDPRPWPNPQKAQPARMAHSRGGPGGNAFFA